MTKMGEVKRIVNTTKPCFSHANNKYRAVWVFNEHGNIEPLMFTDDEYQSALGRAYKNTKAMPELKLNLWQRLKSIEIGRWCDE